MNMIRTSLFLFVLFFGLVFPVPAAEAPVLAQKPTLSRTQIVFVCAGDLWSVPREGGAARRLTSGPGTETNPVFSPDGASIAFTAEYDGNTDVYTIPAEGGVPRRLTWHPAADIVLGWTPDGKEILFTSGRTAFSAFNELFTVSRDGGFPKKLPLPQGFEGSFSPDGKRLAYVPHGRAFFAWKRYRGGRATPIWIADLSNSRVEKVPRVDSNDYNPMWVGDKVFFLSDREGPVGLFAYDTKTKKVGRVLDNKGLDLKSAGGGPDAIVYEQFGSLHLYEPKTGRARPVVVTIAADHPEVREKFVDVGDRLTSPSVSPSASRVAFQARGEIVTVPAEKGDARNITNTTGAMERYPAWSPDGRSIAYFSDESGEYMLHIRPQDGKGEAVRIGLEEKPSFYYAPRWSPDSQKIAYVDCHLAIWYVEIEKKKPIKVDKDHFWGGTSDLVPSWSPDSKWLAYSKQLPNYLRAVFLFSLENGRNFQVTDGLSDARSPIFDAGGKYLYFTASTDSGPSREADIHGIFLSSTQSIYLIVLSKTDPSPFTPESDEEKPAEERKKAPDKPEKPEEKAKAGPTAAPPQNTKPAAEAPDKPGAPPAKPPAKDVPVRIDMDGILQRILSVPMPVRAYVDLQVGKAGTLLAIESAAPLPGGTGPFGNTVHRFDLKERRSDVVASGIGAFEMALNGEKYLYYQSGRWSIGSLRPMAPAGTPAPPAAGGPAGRALPTQSVQIRVNPREEWRQMYREVWRIEREFFYDPGLHGLDLEAAQKRYAPFVEAVASRQDLNYLFAEMLGEITVGHLGVGGGDLPQVNRVSTGLLGADYVIENGRYRFARIFNGENWNPQFRAPLTQPGVNVKEGEYLLAVDGREIQGTDNVYRFFEGRSGKQVVLTVGPNPKLEGSRQVTVVPVGNESALRNFAWIEDNRRYVEKRTNGRAAYVYMPDTNYGGYIFFNRYFYAQVGRDAAIIDERFNGGGALATDMVERFSRKLMSLVASRDGADESQPQGAIFGPKVMLINEVAGSGGDAMPYYFRRAKTGLLVGTRTWGGLVGRAGAPDLMDGGRVTAPSSGVWSPEGEWVAENIGIAPDIEVELDPELFRQGKDPQLDKAIDIILNELAKNPPVKPKRPAYPNYHKK